MSEWWTYSLSDFLMFSPRTYYRLFELYNAAIWPAQVAAIALGVTILVLSLRREAWAARAVAAILAACWLWVAWGYLFLRYDTINWAGSYLAIGFAFEALLLAWTGLIRNQLRFQNSPHHALCLARAPSQLLVPVFAIVVLSSASQSDTELLWVVSG
jgi:hypothetical protein